MLAPQRPQGIGAIAHRYCVHAPSLQKAQDGATQSLFIVDQQHGQRAIVRASSSGCRHRRRRLALLRASIAQQLDRKDGSTAVGLRGLGVEPDAAAMVVHDPITDRQAESRAGSHGLRGEEGIENLLLDVGRDAGTGVGHLEAHVRFARRRRADRDGAPAGHTSQGLLGVDQEIEQHLLHLRTVGPRFRIVLVELEIHGDVERRQVI